MSKSGEKKIKKLQKSRIWPSVVMLFFSLILAGVVSGMFMSFTIAYLAKNRLDNEYRDTLRIAQILMAEQDGDGRDRVLDYMQDSMGYAEAVYILDDGEAVAGYGGFTFEPQKSIKLYLSGMETMDIYVDGEAGFNLFSSDGEFDVEALLKECLGEGELPDDSVQGFRDVLYEVPFWISVPMQGQSVAVVKQKLEFYREDFRLSLVMGGLSAVVMFLPVLFLTINLIINVRAQRRMRKLLYTDPVTMGNSWLWFEHQANRTLGSVRNAGRLYAVVDLTLMKYRTYCTCHGVKKGEELLESIDRYLSSRITKTECCAHYGQSGFALLLRCDDREGCERRVHDMIDGVLGGLDHGGLLLHGGIYFVDQKRKEGAKKAVRRKDADVAEYFNRASAARASMKEENYSGVALFDGKLLEEQLWEHKVEDRMQGALEREEFKVYIQPKYNPATGQLAGAEALVRWINDEDGFVPPGRFIPIFEKNGFITKLDDYMISHVAKLQAGWLQEGKNVVPVSVNVSRAHFADPDLAEHICRLVDEYQLPHRLMEIELTESAFFDDKESLLNTVRRLKELGFDISMDDFGAGYSSLNSLKDLPLDVLKLDAEFFRGDGEGERGEIVVAQAIDLAKKLDMRIVAEGVEKKTQVDFLASQNCDMIQGFYYAKPMSAEEYETRLGGEEDI